MFLQPVLSPESIYSFCSAGTLAVQYRLTQNLSHTRPDWPLHSIDYVQGIWIDGQRWTSRSATDVPFRWQSTKPTALMYMRTPEHSLMSQIHTLLPVKCQLSI